MQEEFLKDVMQFLMLRGHTRLIPQSGLAEFPDAILNGKRLDLYNLYKEVSSWSWTSNLDSCDQELLSGRTLELKYFVSGVLQVVTRGGFHVGNGINWKGQIFSKMRNYTMTNRMTVCLKSLI